MPSVAVAAGTFNHHRALTSPASAEWIWRPSSATIRCSVEDHWPRSARIVVCRLAATRRDDYPGQRFFRHRGFVFRATRRVL